MIKTEFNVEQKESVSVSTDLKATGIYLSLQMNFQRTIVHDKGTDKEKVFSQDVISETAWANAENEKVLEILETNLEALVKQCIKQAQEKYK
jgi:hypothetical protein